MRAPQATLTAASVSTPSRAMRSMIGFSSGDGPLHERAGDRLVDRGRPRQEFLVDRRPGGALGGVVGAVDARSWPVVRDRRRDPRRQPPAGRRRSGVARWPVRRRGGNRRSLKRPSRCPRCTTRAARRAPRGRRGGRAAGPSPTSAAASALASTSMPSGSSSGMSVETTRARAYAHSTPARATRRRDSRCGGHGRRARDRTGAAPPPRRGSARSRTHAAVSAQLPADLCRSAHRAADRGALNQQARVSVMAGRASRSPRTPCTTPSPRALAR